MLPQFRSCCKSPACVVYFIQSTTWILSRVLVLSSSRKRKKKKPTKNMAAPKKKTSAPNEKPEPKTGPLTTLSDDHTSILIEKYKGFYALWNYCDKQNKDGDLKAAYWRTLQISFSEERRAQRGITPHEHSGVNCSCFLCCEQVAVQ